MKDTDEMQEQQEIPGPAKRLKTYKKSPVTKQKRGIGMVTSKVHL